MAFVHEKSCEAMKSEADLFTVPLTQTTIEGSRWVQYNPISTINDTGPIEFLIPGSGDHYIDLGKTDLHVVAQIVTSDGRWKNMLVVGTLVALHTGIAMLE